MALLLITGCEKWADGVVREVDFPTHEPELAATVVLRTGDLKAVACLVQSASTLDPVGSTIPEGAEARLTHDGTVILTWLPGDTAGVGSSWDYRTMHVLHLSEPLDLPLGAIELTVEAPGFAPLTATAIQPPAPQFQAALTLGVDSVMDSWYYGGVEVYDRVDFSLQNRPSLRDAYGVSFLTASADGPGDTTWYPAYLGQDEFNVDPRLQFNASCGCYLLDDQGFDAQSFEGLSLNRIRYQSPDWPDEETSTALRMSVDLMDPALADFYRSVDVVWNASGNPFANPSTVFSNTSTGYGCFGLASRKTLDLQ